MKIDPRLALSATLAFGSLAPTLIAQSGMQTGAHQVVMRGVRFWYRVAGAQTAGVPPVVFLHGGPGYSSYSFAAFAGPGLERKLRMVYFDQRGSGESERPWTGDYSMTTLVDDIEHLRRALGVERIALIGHSFGGTLALEYAARYPERVSRMVIVSGASDIPASCRVQRDRLQALYPDSIARVAADSAHTDCDLVFHAFHSGDDFKAFSNRMQFVDSLLRRRQDSVDAASGLRNTGEMGQALFAGGLLTYRFSAYQRLTMPVLVIAGQYDGSVGVAPQRAMRDAMPNATLLVYDHSAHFPYVEEPERFARDVTRFLTEPRAETRPAEPSGPRAKPLPRSGGRA